MHTVTRNKGKKGFGRVFIMSRSRHVEKIGSGSSQVFQGSMRCVKSSFPLRIIVFDELELIIKSGPDPIDCKYSFSFCPIVQYDFSVSPSPKNWVLGIFRLGQDFWVRTWGLLGRGTWTWA